MFCQLNIFLREFTILFRLFEGREGGRDAAFVWGLCLPLSSFGSSRRAFLSAHNDVAQTSVLMR